MSIRYDNVLWSRCTVLVSLSLNMTFAHFGGSDGQLVMVQNRNSNRPTSIQDASVDKVKIHRGERIFECC
jgi:hypothetical protein